MSKGFTLIELMVTVGIFVFMTALILANYTAFNSGTLLTNLGYDVALTVRQAQTYGISVRAVNADPSSATNFSAPYGVAFTKTTGSICSSPTAPEPNSFVLFADTAGTGKYNCSAGENAGTYNLKQGAIVSALCVSSGGICSAVTNLYITFKRPDPSAIICADSGACPPATPYNYAQIVVRSSDGKGTRTVMVRQNGEIEVAGN